MMLPFGCKLAVMSAPFHDECLQLCWPCDCLLTIMPMLYGCILAARARLAAAGFLTL